MYFSHSFPLIAVIRSVNCLGPGNQQHIVFKTKCNRWSNIKKSRKLSVLLMLETYSRWLETSYDHEKNISSIKTWMWWMCKSNTCKTSKTIYQKTQNKTHISITFMSMRVLNGLPFLQLTLKKDMCYFSSVITQNHTPNQLENCTPWWIRHGRYI